MHRGMHPHRRSRNCGSHASKPGGQERCGSSLSPHWPRQNHFWVPGSQVRLLVPEILLVVISAPTSFFTYLDQNGHFQETIRPRPGTVSPALYTRQIAAAWKPPCCSTEAPCCSTSHKVLFNHSHFAPGSSGEAMTAKCKWCSNRFRN